MTKGGITFLVIFAGLGLSGSIAVYRKAIENHPSRVVHAQSQDTAPRFGPVQESANGAFRMRTESHTNASILTFHVSERMTTSVYEDLEVATAESPNLGLLRDLSQLPGIKHVAVRPYEVVVEKGEVFEWSEIMAPIATTIRLRLEPRQAATNVVKPLTKW